MRETECRQGKGNSIEAKAETDMQIWKLKGLQKHVTTTMMINRDWHERCGCRAVQERGKGRNERNEEGCCIGCIAARLLKQQSIQPASIDWLQMDDVMTQHWT
ncbi:hypothetical protein WR25_16002 [Diploscapter pachys]|uniref:Uncharacterized protein n=1 Tax=Diploscapter pachys TaxID=2018661 RepID=A0A2A2KXW7_9BILA|nr:hypothetical protein WR25_16002 [Diploscapter pachys]